ncbi:hypothetical protein ACC689_36565, partial [Rhizobium ruizarguesonis]
LAFPLRNRGVAEPDVDRRVREILDMIDLADWAKRRSRGLTADQKQKISLGRGLVRKHHPAGVGKLQMHETFRPGD